MLELEAQAPEKFDRDDLDFQFKVSKTNLSKTDYVDTSSYDYRAHMQRLLAEYFSRKDEDESEIEQIVEKKDYPTLSPEQTQELLAEYFARKDTKNSSK